MKLCCICDQECYEEDEATLFFCHNGELKQYDVCCPSCAEILINRKEKEHESHGQR